MPTIHEQVKENPELMGKITKRIECADLNRGSIAFNFLTMHKNDIKKLKERNETEALNIVDEAVDNLLDAEIEIQAQSKELNEVAISIAAHLVSIEEQLAEIALQEERLEAKLQSATTENAIDDITKCKDLLAKFAEHKTEKKNLKNFLLELKSEQENLQQDHKESVDSIYEAGFNPIEAPVNRSDAMTWANYFKEQLSGFTNKLEGVKNFYASKISSLVEKVSDIGKLLTTSKEELNHLKKEVDKIQPNTEPEHKITPNSTAYSR